MGAYRAPDAIMIWNHSAAAILAVLAHTSIALAQGAVPAGIEVPTGHAPFLAAHAEGTQNYVCVLGPSGFGFQFQTPVATLADDDLTQVATHFLSPNPVEDGAARATWQHSTDTSRVWATTIASSTDAAFVAPGAIPWLLLKVVGQQDGPSWRHDVVWRHSSSTASTPRAGRRRQRVARPRRTSAARRSIPYEADYVFYR